MAVNVDGCPDVRVPNLVLHVKDIPSETLCEGDSRVTQIVDSNIRKIQTLESGLEDSLREVRVSKRRSLWGEEDLIIWLLALTPRLQSLDEPCWSYEIPAPMILGCFGIELSAYFQE